MVTFQYFCETEISEADVTIFVHENVLGLQVTVDNLFAVKVTECHGNLNRIKTRSLFRESCNLSQVREQLTTSHKSHDEEHFLLRLEDVIHTDQEGVISLHENVLLEFRRLNLVILNDYILAEGLHGVGIVRSTLLDEKHFSEGAATDDRLDNEVAQADVLFLTRLGETWRDVTLCRQFFFVI